MVLDQGTRPMDNLDVYLSQLSDCDFDKVSPLLRTS